MAESNSSLSMDEQLKDDIEKRINDSIKIANKKRDKFNKGIKWYFLYIIGAIVIIFAVFLKFTDVNDSEDLFTSSILAFLFAIPVGLALRFIFSIIIDGYYDSVISKLQRELSEEKRKLLKYGQDFFTNLVDVNLKHIDQYYLQTQNQANKSFFLALFASVCGLTLITIGVIFAYQSAPESNSIDAGKLATIAGVITEFIAAIIFYLYSKTIASMADYHTKLVLTQNISLALKSAEMLTPDKKSAAVDKVISELTTGVNSFISKGTNNQQFPR